MTIPGFTGPSYEDPGLWPTLARRIEEEIASRSDGVLSGKVKSLEDYREQLGRIGALKWVLDEAREMLNPKGDDA